MNKWKAICPKLTKNFQASTSFQLSHEPTHLFRIAHCRHVWTISRSPQRGSWGGKKGINLGASPFLLTHPSSTMSSSTHRLPTSFLCSIGRGQALKDEQENPRHSLEAMGAVCPAGWEHLLGVTHYIQVLKQSDFFGIKFMIGCL